jgi:hypothetical protein
VRCHSSDGLRGTPDRQLKTRLDRLPLTRERSRAGRDTPAPHGWLLPPGPAHGLGCLGNDECASQPVCMRGGEAIDCGLLALRGGINMRLRAMNLWTTCGSDRPTCT